MTARFVHYFSLNWSKCTIYSTWLVIQLTNLLKPIDKSVKWFIIELQASERKT